MANEELTRSQYLRALYEQRRLLNANSSVYVNPSVTNQVDIQANNSQEGFDFSFANNIALREKEQELKELQESQNKTEEEKNETALGKIFGFVDEIAAKFGQGFVGAFEGILDLGALGLGAITGDDRFKDWAAINYAERAAEWTKNYGNFTIHGLVNSFEHLDDENYRRNFLAGVFGGPAAAAVQTLRPDTNLGAEYYGGAQDVLQSMGGVGNFVGGAAESIGFMIPSIMTGGAAAAANAPGWLAKGASLLSMGLSAAGKGGEEAVQEGATAGQALAYGAAKGTVEVVSEIVVGKALEGIAKATGLSKYLGTFGKINGVTYSKEIIKKAAAKELMTTMIEEGAEEVFSDLFAPLCEAIYKGNDAFKQYGDSDYYKQMALSFASGALIGGLTSGVQTASQYSAYGKAGVAYLQNNQEFQEAYREFQNNQSEANANKCKEILNNMYNQLLEMANNPAEAKHLQNLVEAFVGNNVTTEQGIESLKASLSEDVYQKLVNDVNSIFESTTGKSVSIVPESSLKQVDGAYPKAFISGDSIVINENYKTQLMELIKHEGVSHAILDLDTNLRSDLIKAIEKNTKLSAEFHKYDAELEQNYKKSELESERLAKFTEKVLNNYSSFEQALKQSYKSKRLLARLYTSLLDKIAKIKGIDKKYVKTIRTVLSELQGTQTSEQVQTEPQVAYAKDTLVGKYTVGSNKMVEQVKKTANGYDIYENGKLVKEGISATEVKESLDSWNAKKIVNQKPAKQETSERAKAFQKARETMKEVQNKAKGKKQSKKTETQTQLKPKIVYKVEPSQPVKIGKNIPVYQLTENGEILVKTVQKVSERNYIVKTRNKATNKVTNKSFDSYKKARESVLKEKNISNVLKDLNKAKTKAEKPAAKPKQSKAERKAEQQVKKAVQAQETIEKRAEPKDTWEGKYIAGDNKLAYKVVKTSTGYDIYEKSKLLKGYEGITLDELQKFLTENKLRRQAYKQAEERRIKAQEDRAKKTVLGRWLINDGKDELKVNKYQGKYQVHNRNEIIGEYENADQVRAYMQEAHAEKYVNLQPKKLNDRFYISRNRTVYVKDGSDILSKVLAKSDNGFIVTTTNITGDGNVWTKEFTSEKAAKNAIDTFTVKSYKKADIEKVIATQEQIIKEQNAIETKQEKRQGKKAKAKVETKVETKPEQEEFYKTVKTTEDIIKGVKKFVESREGKVQIAFPKNFENFTSKSFTELNSVKKIDVETRKISELLMKSTLRAYDDVNNEWVKVNELGDVLSAQEKLDLEKEIKRLIEESGSEKAKSAETKPFQVSIERLADKVSKTVSKTKETRLLTNLRRTIKRTLPQPTKINRDNVSRNGLDFMLYPIYNLKGQTTYSQKGVVADFNEVKGMYEEIAKNPAAYPDIPYYAEVSQMIDDIIDSIGEPTRRADGVLVYGNMSAQTEHLIRMYGETVKFINNQVKAKIIQNYQPAAIQTMNVMNSSKYGNKTDKVSSVFRMFKRGFAPSYVVLRQMFGGNSRVAQLLTTDYQNAQNSKQVYYGSYSDAVKRKLKELGIKRQFNKRQFNINGADLTTDQAMYLYISSNVESNFDAMNENGVKYYDKHGRTRVLAEKGNAEALKKQVTDVLPENYKKFADWLLNTMNDSVKADYIDWYEKRFGKFNRRNEIGGIKENKYWSLRRAYEKMNSVETAVANPEGVFSNAKSRVKNDNAVMIGGALSTFTTYVDKLGTELYLKPIYREAIATLNTKVDGKSIVSTMAEKLDPQDSRYLTKTMDDMVGALKNTNDIFTGVMSRFSVAKLSLNIGTMGKQFASIFTSNIPIYSSVQGFVHRWSETFKNEYQTLVDGVRNEDGTWKTEPIGGLKYRNGSNIVKANADSLSQLSEKIAEAGMVGITAVDKFTINTGVFSLMMIGQNQFGLKVGTQANIDFVREQWHEFELSQIGSGVLSKNALGRGDYGSLAKGLFGFLQGANRAALGSQINKIDLWRRNRGLSKAEVENARENARKAVTDYEESHKNEEGKFQTAELSVEEQEKYVELVATKIDAETKYDDYIKYRVAGGKAIPVNLAAGLIAQGLFVTLINELMKRIRGRKEWDEVDVAELGLNTALAIGVDWVPFVNTISSMIKGYDVQVPAVEIFKEIGTVLSNVTQGNWQKSIRELAILIGDSTGIPFQTIYDYMYGIIKTFDVGTAEEFKSVLYGLTPQSATKTLNHYVEKKNEKKVLSMLNVVLDNYRVNTSDSVKSEMAQLLIDGKEVLPQQFMTSYEDENGEKAELSAEQIKVFREYYDQADEAAQKLISSSSYKSLDNDRKAKLLKKLYSHYYAFAKYQVAKIEPSSRLGKLLVLTNGNLDLANYLVYLEDLGNIVATKAKTKKELAIKYINKISGKTKGEKLLLMLLAGYSVAEKEKNKVISQLVKLGLSRKQAKEFIG